jgi:CRP-like cAMP-binding protein
MGVRVELFRNETDVEQFAPSDVIFREGDRGEAMYVVVEGTVELSTNSGRLKEVVGPGDVIGEMALIDHEPRAATARAHTACRLARIPEKRFLFMVRETPHFALQIMRIMAERLRRRVNR